ncbi:histidine phosphatase family protein [Robbsia sp. KACC 23696]|uniref:histidine phosphatase family protein n=1 Tax=Robbsia sp. KACC 23696 TaxID=3149231 RepID=UPI00325B77ED
MAPTIVLLIRHGETAWNAVKRIQGQIDIPLSEVGLAQAEALARRWTASIAGAAADSTPDGGDAGGLAAIAGAPLIGEVGSSVPRDASAWVAPLSAIVSSDLSRAMQTAAPLLRVLAPDAAATDVVQAVGLRERLFGVFERHDKAAIAQRWPAAYAQWITHDPDFAPESGESIRTLSQRVVQTLGEQARRYAGGTIACVAHGGVLDCALRFAQGVALDAPRPGVLLNASINALRWYPGQTPAEDRAEVLAWGDVAHLGDFDAKGVGDDRV